MQKKVNKFGSLSNLKQNTKINNATNVKNKNVVMSSLRKMHDCQKEISIFGKGKKDFKIALYVS